MARLLGMAGCWEWPAVGDGRLLGMAGCWGWTAVWDGMAGCAGRQLDVVECAETLMA